MSKPPSLSRRQTARPLIRRRHQRRAGESIADAVLSENSIEPNSSRIAMTEVEQTTKPFASADGATAVIRGCHERRADESIADAVVLALQIVVPDILSDDESEMPLGKRDDAEQALAEILRSALRGSTTHFDLIRSPCPAKELTILANRATTTRRASGAARHRN